MARILLIEDNDPIRALLRDTLELAGHTVIEARNGQEGLDLFRQAGGDLVITDILMPETEGLGVLVELRNAQPPVKVIAMSGGGRGNLATAKLLGAAKVLLKPFPIAVLIAAIEELLPGAGASTRRAACRGPCHALPLPDQPRKHEPRGGGG